MKDYVKRMKELVQELTAMIMEVSNVWKGTDTSMSRDEREYYFYGLMSDFCHRHFDLSLLPNITKTACDSLFTVMYNTPLTCSKANFRFTFDSLDERILINVSVEAYIDELIRNLKFLQNRYQHVPQLFE